MADILAAVAAEFASASWAVPFPAGSAGNRQLAVLAIESDTVTVSLAGWQAAGVYDHSASLCRAHVFVRTLTGAVSAGTSVATLSESWNGTSVAATIDGEFVSVLYAEAGWATTFSGGTTFEDGARATVAVATEFPRTFAASSGTILAQVAGGDGPSMVIVEDQAVGTAVAVTLTATDANDPFADGSTQWLALTFIYGTPTTPPPSGGAQPDVTAQASGTFFGVDPFTVSVPAAGAGHRRYIAIAHSASATDSVEFPATFTLVGASDVDAYETRLLLLEQTLASASGITSVTINPTGLIEGAWIAFSVSGARVDFQRNAGLQSNYQTTVAIPPVSAGASPALLVSVIASNFPRIHSPGGDIFELADVYSGNAASLALGRKYASAGVINASPWTPVDVYNPAAEGGDLYRSFAMAFVGTGAGSPTPAPPPAPPPASAGSLTVTASGAMAYVATPTQLQFATTGNSQVTATWSDIAGDETSYQYQIAPSSQEYTTSGTLSPNVATVTIPSLLPGTQYKFRVRAIRVQDASAWLNGVFQTGGTTVNTITLAATTTSGTVGNPIAVTVTADPSVAGQTVTWTVGAATLSGATAFNAAGVATAFVTPTAIGTLQVSARVGNSTSNVVTIVVGSGVVESLVLTVMPSRIEPNQVAIARVTGSVNGVSFIGSGVALSSSNGSVIAAPSSGVIAGDLDYAEYAFQIPGLAPGTTNLQATVGALATTEEVGVGGQSIGTNGEVWVLSSPVTGVFAVSNTVSVVVAVPEPPVEYAASGVTAAAIGIEAPLASASRPRVRRMTHGDQQAYYPGDDGFKFAVDLPKKEHVFFTKSKFK